MLLIENETLEDHHIAEPLLFRIYLEEDKKNLERLLKQKPHIKIRDQIGVQLDDLVKSLHPHIKKPDQKLLDKLKKAHLGTQNLEEYGVWIYYPWNNLLTHVLDRDEFIEVRTNRNRYKITREEQQILNSKKIGIIGLSVGQSIALTLAMERTCGELRLADFDTAELSNLNRLRTGVHNIGIHKTVIAAREIAEIDPFIKVIIFNEGLHQDNIDAFFTEGGNLDLMVEVCDGLDVKIESRFKAKSLGIPVIMDTNDKGMLDVERFDLQPNRDILHGLANGLDPLTIRDLTNEQKIPYILKMIGADDISTRLKASMLEVEQSINTWPQLASSVVLGGALTTDVSRRILLNQFHDSGRYYVDFEDLVKNKEPQPKSASILENPYNILSITAINDIIGSYFKSEAIHTFILEENQLDKIIDAAIAAPSAGNNQPWKLSYKNGVLFIFHDKYRSWSWGDYYEMGSHMGLGTLIENINLQSQALGLKAHIQLLPTTGVSQLIATIHFDIDNSLISSNIISSAEHIFLRYTNRKLGPRQKLEKTFFDNLVQETAKINNVGVYYKEDTEELSELADIIAECDKIRLMDEQGHEEFYHEIRWSPEQAASTRDGIELRAVDITPSEIAGFKVAKDWNAIKLISDWDKGNAFKKMSLSSVKSASAIVLFTIPEFTHKNLINVGRAVELAWIFSSQQGVSVHPMLSPAFFFNRLIHGKGAGLTEKNINKLKSLRSKFIDIFPELKKANESEVFIMKVGLAEDIGVRALRRNKTDIYIDNLNAENKGI